MSKSNQTTEIQNRTLLQTQQHQSENPTINRASGSETSYDATMPFSGGAIESQAQTLQRLDRTQGQRAMQSISRRLGNQHVQRVITAYRSAQDDSHTAQQTSDPIPKVADVQSLKIKHHNEVVIPNAWELLKRKAEQRNKRIPEMMRLLKKDSPEYTILTGLDARFSFIRGALKNDSFTLVTTMLTGKGSTQQVFGGKLKHALENDKQLDLADKKSLTGEKFKNTRGAIQEFVEALDYYLECCRKLEEEQKEFHRFDSFFDHSDISKLLIGPFTPADVKAMVCAETGDLTDLSVAGIKGKTQGILTPNSRKSPYIGLGQHDADAKKAAIAWAKKQGVTIPDADEKSKTPDPRTIPELSIKLSAAYLGHLTNWLQSNLPAPLPTGDELKNIVYFAYNPGPGATVKAAKSFQNGKSKPYTWNDLVPFLNSETKKTEVKKYIPEIGDRIPKE
ncbi:MAG: hypothetical protein JXA21_07080 [Anaerolineae bacterium]|nr:hypothetical protein [Anaerolineae bacterium]